MTQYDNLNPQKQMKRLAMVNRKIITTNYTYIFPVLLLAASRHENTWSNNYSKVLVGVLYSDILKCSLKEHNIVI